MAVAAVFGASQVLDVYLMALVLIGVPVAVVAMALQTTLVPALVGRSPDAAAGLLGGALKWTLAILAVALPIWLAILPYALNFLYPANRESATSELFSACIWLIPYYLSNGAALLFYGALQARKVFWANALCPGMFPLAILALLAFLPQADIRVLLVGTVIGSGLECLVLVLLLLRGRLLRWNRTAGSGLLHVMRLAMPLMISTVVVSFSPVVEQMIAYRLSPGSVSLLNYGNKVPAALNSLLVMAIGIVVLPHFADLVMREEWRACRKLFLRLCLIAVGTGLLVAGAGIISADLLVRVLFERGAFTQANSEIAANVMQMYLVQLPFLLIVILSHRALIALSKTQSLAVFTMLQLVLGGLFAFMLSEPFGVMGVALGTSIGTIFGAVSLISFAWWQMTARVETPAK